MPKIPARQLPVKSSVCILQNLLEMTCSKFSGTIKTAHYVHLHKLSEENSL